jgi:hypothetical protein
VVLLVTINVVFGAFTQTVNIGVTAVRQAITPDLVQGRVSATIRFCGLGLAPLGSSAGGFLGTVVDLRMGVLLAAASLCLSPLFMVFSPLARLGVHLPKHQPVG